MALRERDGYTTLSESDWWVAETGSKVACCDCGLTHEVEVKVERRFLRRPRALVRFIRDDAETDRKRRDGAYPGAPG